MKCPKCGGKARTYDSRPRMDNRNWRRKRCVVCDYRFTTIEMTSTDFAKELRR